MSLMKMKSKLAFSGRCIINNGIQNHYLVTNWKPGGAAGTEADFVQTLALQEALQLDDSFFTTCPLLDINRLLVMDARLLL